MVQPSAGGGELVAVLFVVVPLVLVLWSIGLAEVRRIQGDKEFLPAWTGEDPLPAPHLCPTSTKLLEAQGGLQLVQLEVGWARGHGTTYAWTAGVRLPPGAMGRLQLRVVLLGRDDAHLPAGDGMGNFFADSRQTRDEDVADLVRIMKDRLAPHQLGQLTWVTALAPIQRLPGGKPGTPRRARARLELTTGEGRRLVATTPFAYVPRYAPADRIDFLEVELEETQCPVCGDPLAGRPTRACPRCHTPHHADCWSYLGTCAIFGCRG